jgi:hypothetical protein
MNTVGTQKQQRKKLARPDRALCQVQVAGWLGIRVHHIAAAMRANDVVMPLDIKAAKRWVGGTEPMPDWFAALLTQKPPGPRVAPQRRKLSASKTHRRNRSAPIGCIGEAR